MRIAELLKSIASWLESPNNEAILLSEYDELCLEKVATACVAASNILKQAATEVEVIEPQEPSKITAESIQALSDIATAYDQSGDKNLQKIADVIDEIILKMADDAKKDHDSSKKDIDKSKVIKEYNVLEHPMSTRHCPDHPGTSVSRIGDGQFQCPLDKKVYDFNEGYTKEDGAKVPGYSVAEQSQIAYNNPQISIFDTRESRIYQ